MKQRGSPSGRAAGRAERSDARPRTQAATSTDGGRDRTMVPATSGRRQAGRPAPGGGAVTAGRHDTADDKVQAAGKVGQSHISEQITPRGYQTRQPEPSVTARPQPVTYRHEMVRARP